MSTRRQFVLQASAGFALYALLGELRAAGPATPLDTRVWLRRHDELAGALARGEIAPLAWQDGVEALARRVDREALLAEAARSEQRESARPTPTDPVKRTIVFKDTDGQRLVRHYGVALFRFDPDNVITPHGHRHMVSAHLVVQGRLRVRNFDRIGDEAGAMWLKPTRDYLAGEGDISSMSQARDNVHWFVPQGGAAATFDVVVSGLTPGEKAHVIEAVDPLRATARADGSLRVPIIGFDESSRRYGPQV